MTATGRPHDCHRAPTRDAPTDAWGLTPFEGRVSGPRGRFLAWARVARLCVYFNRAGEIAGLGRIGGEIGADVGEGRVAHASCVYFEQAVSQGEIGNGIGAEIGGDEMVQTWGRGGSCVGLDGSGPGNGWHGRVTFFSGTGERVGRVWARVCGRGVRWGVRGKLGKQYGERKAMAAGPESGAGAGCSRGRRFRAHLVI